MTNYKDTLNLPETAFPMRGDLAKREPAMLDEWYNNNLYQQIRKAKKGKKTFILHDGPPYANGNLHIGHSVNKVLKDIIIKSKTLSGFDSPYVPGWDCHGLPIELKVEELIGKAGDKVSAAEFRQACRTYAQQQIDNQRKDFIRLGVLGDWQNPYLTMDFQTEANIIRALAQVVENGHLHRGAKPVHWCCDCQSSLAEAEVEYYDKTSNSIYLRFLSEDPKALATKFGVTQSLPSIAIIIWTTTPWTLPANRAIAVHPNFIYQLIEAQGEHFILARELVDEVLQKLGINDYKVLGECQGADLELLPFKHPFLALTSPIILGEHVTLDAGTGAVHTAPGHGPEDYVVAQRYQIEIANPVGGDGRYLVGTYPELDGMLVLKANDKVCEILTQAGAMLLQEKIQHSYPCCWRHKTPIIFRATPQWFISMDKQGLRTHSLSEIKQVKWIPEWGEARIAGMVENRPDWCISRQRTWGVPIPLFIHKITGEIHPNSVALMQQVALSVEKEGIQAWWDLSIEALLGDEASQYDKINDTLDVWFDSGSTSYSVVKQRAEFEGSEIDLYLEGSDQHRGWFMSSLMIATAISKKAPYKQVLTHGFTVDGQGRKMSKSVGNVVSPQQVIDKMGADILRLWVAATDYTGEIAVSDEILKRSADSYRRIRNTARFLLANLNGFTPAQHLIQNVDLILLDRWAVGCAYQAQQDIIAAYERYDFHSVVQRIMQFCSVEMGSFYLDIIKDRQYTAKVDSVARRSCQTALYHITQALVRWIAPILSFTADEIWQHLPDQDTRFVFCDEWYSELTPLSQDEAMNSDYWQTLLLVRDQVNKVLEKARNDKLIGSSLAATITLYVSKDLEQKLLALNSELRFVLLTSGVEVLPLEQAPLEALMSDDDRLPLKMVLAHAAGVKCPRCWHYTDQTETTDELCPRCVTNVHGQGEVRRFA